MHKLESVPGNKMHKILESLKIKTDPLIQANRPELVRINI